jgi:hypothetical protein
MKLNSAKPIFNFFSIEKQAVSKEGRCQLEMLYETMAG